MQNNSAIIELAEEFAKHSMETIEGKVVQDADCLDALNIETVFDGAEEHRGH